MRNQFYLHSGLLLAAGLLLTGCADLYDDGDYYARPPSEYLIDEQGNYIDANGVRVDKPVVNPYYTDYMKNAKQTKMQLVRPTNAPAGANYEEDPY